MEGQNRHNLRINSAPILGRPCPDCHRASVTKIQTKSGKTLLKCSVRCGYFKCLPGRGQQRRGPPRAPLDASGQPTRIIMPLFESFTDFGTFRDTREANMAFGATQPDEESFRVHILANAQYMDSDLATSHFKSLTNPYNLNPASYTPRERAFVMAYYTHHQPETRLCNCPRPSRALKVKKQGPNTGRTFLTCSNGQCTFFEWETPLEEKPRPRPSGDTTTTLNGIFADNTDNTDNTDNADNADNFTDAPTDCQIVTGAAPESPGRPWEGGSLGPPGQP